MPRRGWREAIRHHGFDTVFASAWGIQPVLAQPGLLLVGHADHRCVDPVDSVFRLRQPRQLGMRTRALGSLPHSRGARPAGRAARSRAANLRAGQHAVAALPVLEQHDGFVRAAVDPFINAAASRPPRAPAPPAARQSSRSARICSSARSRPGRPLCRRGSGACCSPTR